MPAHQKRGPGRPKGSKNAKPRAAEQMYSIREAFSEAFSGLGLEEKMSGVEVLRQWGRENKTEFYKLAARLIPVEVTGQGGGPIQITTRAE